jgi:hypothetical protein
MFSSAPTLTFCAPTTVSGVFSVRDASSWIALIVTFTMASGFLPSWGVVTLST